MRAGAFAEAVREQWLQERIEYFSELEAAIYHEALGADECDRAQVLTALMKVDVNLTDDQVGCLARLWTGAAEVQGAAGSMKMRGLIVKGLNEWADGSFESEWTNDVLDVWAEFDWANPVHTGHI